MTVYDIAPLVHSYIRNGTLTCQMMSTKKYRRISNFDLKDLAYKEVKEIRGSNNGGVVLVIVDIPECYQN